MVQHWNQAAVTRVLTRRVRDRNCRMRGTGKAHLELLCCQLSGLLPLHGLQLLCLLLSQQLLPLGVGAGGPSTPRLLLSLGKRELRILLWGHWQPAALRTSVGQAARTVLQAL